MCEQRDTLHHSWKEAKQLFAHAIDLPADTRLAFLKQYASSHAIAAEAARLCEAADVPDNFLVTPKDPLIGEFTNSVTCVPEASTAQDPLLGKLLGNFRLVRRIGLGAMGVVYEAQQLAPRRQVAVKILRGGCFSENSQTLRFLHESEILAQLQHPGVVRVFASGTMPSNFGEVPWFAMELIDGVSLDQWYASETSVPAKLRLLCQICDAVGHAHHRNIVHRDLKPANILVLSKTDSGGANEREIRILDFGISRVLDQRANSRSHTRTGSMIGTLNYMSPEQFDGGEIDAQTDVYALGTVGFEMLTGCLPYPTTGKTVSEIISDRKNDEPIPLGRLMKSFKGDLEAVFSRALSGDRAERYATATDLADDIRRFLDNRPVTARRLSMLGTFTKYVRRNRISVFSAASVIAALAIGMIMYATEASKAQQKAQQFAYEAKKSRALNNFLTNDLFTKLINETQRSSESGSQEHLTPEQMIARATEKIDQLFGDDPLMEASVRNEVGTLYYNLGLFQSAIDEYEQAETLWSEQLGDEHADTLKAISNLGLCFMVLKDSVKAEAKLLQALHGRRRALTPYHPDLAVSLNNLSLFYRSQERFGESEQLLRNAIEIGHAAGDLREPMTYTANLARVQIDQGKVDKGLLLLQKTHDECVAKLGPHDRLSLQIAFSLANHYRQQDRFRQAHEIIEPTLAGRIATLGENDPLTISTRRLVAKVQVSLGEFDKAKKCLEAALDAARSSSNSDDALIAKLQEELKDLKQNRLKL